MGVDSAAIVSGTGSSAKYYRAWSGSSNANSDCASGDKQYFGDAKGLDLWALEKSQVYKPQVVVLPASTTVDVGTQVSVTGVVQSGGTAYGSFVFMNASTVTATGVTYAVTLGNPAVPATCPDSVTFTSKPSGVTPTYTKATCKITFNGMPTSLTANQSLTFGFNYVVAATNPGPIPITTTIAASNETNNQMPNTATAQTVVAQPIVSVSKVANPGEGSAVPVGSTITYVLSVDVSNAPLTSALSLSDTLGAGLQFGSIVSSSPALVCTGSLNCSLDSGSGIGTYSVTYTATVLGSAGATVNNSVVASGGGSTPICNSCSVTNTVQRTRLTVAKNMAGRLLSTDQFTVSIGAASSVVVASNTSSGNASSVSTGAVDVTAGTAYTLSEAAAGSPLADLSRYTSTYACTNATAGGTAVSASGTGTSVSVTPQAGDDITCTFTNTPKYPGITATKTASPTTLVAGGSNQKYQISVVVTNGPTTAAIALTDTLPTGVTLSGAPQLIGGGTLASCGNSSGSAIGPNCSLASGLANGTYTIDIPVRVASTAVAGGASNTAHLSGGGDPACTSSDTKCNPSTGTVTVEQKADLRIEKTATPDGSYVPDQSLNYQIVVTNDGPSDVDGASIQDTVPAKVSVSLWSCTPATGADCGLNASGTDNNVSLTGVKIPAGKSVTINVTGKAQRSATGDIVNTATVTPPTSTPCATAACVLTDTVTNQNSGKPVLVIDKLATPSVFAVGGRGLYTITVENTGTGSTTDVITVTDTMPAGITIDTTKVSGEG